ncbi:hypothetical protein O0L34_g15047 [Tuta absoluta]|nr:hypothetical protein O0L34_g15047 [Tuta absoluta]
MRAEELLLLGFICCTAGNEEIMPLTPGLLRQSEGACRGMAKTPFFDVDSVIGKPWRMYYTWNIEITDQCVDFHFQKASPAIIRRINYDMSRSVAKQPEWENASLLMTAGRNRQEMLLIPEKDIPGRFIAVPNDFSDVMPGGLVPLLRFQLKLFRRGKFLVFVDCMVGIASVLARFDQPPYRMDIDSVALEMAPHLGDGNHACVNEINFLENILLVQTYNNARKKKPLMF